jgi:hypothetical protein
MAAALIERLRMNNQKIMPRLALYDLGDEVDTMKKHLISLTLLDPNSG